MARSKFKAFFLMAGVSALALGTPLGFAGQGPEVTRRFFISGLGASTLTVAAPPHIFSSSVAPVDLGVYDSLIYNEGYASMMEFLIFKAMNGTAPVSLGARNWKSLLGIGGWFKFYSVFQSLWPLETRFSSESDKAFIARAQKLTHTSGASARALFQMAFSDSSAATMDLRSLARLSLGFLSQSEAYALDSKAFAELVKRQTQELLNGLPESGPASRSSPEFEFIKPGPVRHSGRLYSDRGMKLVSSFLQEQDLAKPEHAVVSEDVLEEKARLTESASTASSVCLDLLGSRQDSAD